MLNEKEKFMAIVACSGEAKRVFESKQGQTAEVTDNKVPAPTAPWVSPAQEDTSKSQAMHSLCKGPQVHGLLWRYCNPADDR